MYERVQEHSPQRLQRETCDGAVGERAAVERLEVEGVLGEDGGA